MYISLTLGNDSLAARLRDGDERRNVSVRAFCYSNVPDNGKHIIPLYRGHVLKAKGFGEQHVAGTIPATSIFAHNDVGKWVIGRYEVSAGAEIMIEYRHRDPDETFGEEVEYLLLVAGDMEALCQIRLTLPEHSLSNVPYVGFEGRFAIVDEESDLSRASLPHWKTFLGLDSDDNMADVLEPNLGWEHFHLIIMEEAPKVSVKKEVVTSKGGKSRVTIRRKRNVKTS